MRMRQDFFLSHSFYNLPNFLKFFSTQKFTKGGSTIGNTLLTGCLFFLILIYVI